MSAVSTSLQIALLASGQSVEVDTVVPDMAKVSAAHKDVGRQYPPPPPHRLTAAAMDASFVEPVEQSSQGSLGRSCASGGGGGGVAHPLTSGPPVLCNLHGW